MNIFDEFDKPSRVKMVGLAPARLKSINVDNNLTSKGQKRLDLNLEFEYKKDNEIITQPTKCSFWFKNTEDITTTNESKAKFIDNRGNSTYYIPNKLSKYKADFEKSSFKPKELENINISNMRIAYLGEVEIINALKVFLGYNKNVKSDFVKISDNDGYFFIKDWYDNKSEKLNELNEYLTQKIKKAIVMLGVNEKGYSIVYPRQFSYGSNLEIKTEKDKANFEKIQSYFIKIKENYKRDIVKALDSAKGDVNIINEIMKYRTETDFYYTGLAVEYDDELRQSELAIDYALIRQQILSEYGIESNIDNKLPF